MTSLTLNKLVSLASMTVENGCLTLEVTSSEPVTSYNTAYFPWLQEFSTLDCVTVRDAASGVDYVFSGLSKAAFEYDPCTSTYVWHFRECCPPFSGTLEGSCPRPCFVAGTRLSTPGGARPVEELAAGERVMLAGGGSAPIRWIGHRRSRNAAVVRFTPGSLGDGVPRRDLVVSPDHAMALGDCLVPAEALANGTTILQERLADALFFHVELDRHGVLLAEDAPAESYLDTGNRAQFSNCPIGGVAAARDVEATPCLEMVREGARLAGLIARLPAASDTVARAA